MISVICILLLESFTYLGFFTKHIGASSTFIILLTLVIGFLISVIPVGNFGKKNKWFIFCRKSFQVNIKILLVSLLFTLLLNTVEYFTYDNFIYSKIHIQPKLLYRALALMTIALYVNLSLIIRNGDDNYFIQSFRLFKKRYKLTASIMKDLLLVLFSVIVIVFTLTSSVKFIYKFYQPDNSFLKEYELKYFKGQITILEWIDVFFPQTSDLVKWCNSQSNPVELVTLDPQMIWMNYEGMTRVFLTNCYYANIYSENETYSYIGKKNILLTTVSKCNKEKKDYKGNPNDNKYIYLNDVNNYYICHSKEIVPGLYKYETDK